MKIIYIILMMVVMSNADEMQRIEAIVDDITQLRVDYEECKTELKNKDTIRVKAKKQTSKKDNKYKKLYEKEKTKNIILKAKVDFNGDLTKSNKILSLRVLELEKQLKLAKKPLKTKCKSENNNTFPKLMMKEVNEKKLDKQEKSVKIKSKKEKIIKFKATSFKLKTDSIIYNGINGKNIGKWVKTTSFTSNTKTATWIKISGYFIDKKWTSAKKPMWIKKAQVVKK